MKNKPSFFLSIFYRRVRERCTYYGNYTHTVMESVVAQKHLALLILIFYMSVLRPDIDLCSSGRGERQQLGGKTSAV